MKIKRLRIRAFQGIEELDTEIPSNGVIARGSNGTGKTSVLRAIQAALDGRGIGPDAIRLGAEKAEILIDLDDLSVRRAITPKGSQLSVSKDVGGGIVAKLPEPQNVLRRLLGTSTIDPIDLLTERDKKKRRASILQALPCTATEEQVSRWIAGGAPTCVDLTAHGLDVVAKLHASCYGLRKEANATAKEARRKLDELSQHVATLPTPHPDTPTLEAAESAWSEAMRAMAELQARARAAREAEQRTESTRARIASLRGQAEHELDGVTDPTDELEKAKSVRAQWSERVGELEAELSEARRQLSESGLYLQQVVARVEQVAAARRRVVEMKRQADELEAAIGAAVAAPTDDECSAAMQRTEAASGVRFIAQQDAQNNAARENAADALRIAEAAEEDARKLDAIVQRLTNEAPAELLASSGGIPGLTVQGDEILLDGVSLDRLCGREQLRLAVEIARRANAKSCILLVDGLEKLAPENLDEFVRLATADGWQLIASRVEAGERVLEAIQPEEQSPKAQMVADTIPATERNA